MHSWRHSPYFLKDDGGEGGGGGGTGGASRKRRADFVESYKDAAAAAAAGGAGAAARDPTLAMTLHPHYLPEELYLVRRWVPSWLGLWCGVVWGLWGRREAQQTDGRDGERAP